MSSTENIVFRVIGIPSLATVTALGDVLAEAFRTEAITINTRKTTMAPSCYSDGSQTALVQFTPNAPAVLLALTNGAGYDMEFGDTGEAIFVDKDFYGLTPLYETIEGKIQLDIVAVSGLNGHAYGSWRARSNIRPMWLRHFFSQDFPNCRTMTYGYNSKLTALAIHSTADFTKAFLEEVEKARSTEEERTRPIVFIGHSFGGIIIAHALVKAKENAERHGDLFKSTRATIFFGTPHRGQVKSMACGSDVLAIELARFIDYSTSMKIISFYETSQTRKLVMGPDGRWSRSGDFFTFVEASSSVLQLPRNIEVSIPAEGDHSNMVKFTHKLHQSYTSVIKHMKNVVENENLVTVFEAVSNRDADTLSRIFRSTKHVHVDRRYPPDLATLLHLAVANSDKAIVTILVANGVDMNTVNAGGNSALYLAVEKGDEEMVAILLENGAEIAIAGTAHGATALHIAAKHGHPKVTEMLLEHGAVIEAPGESGWSALVYAARDGHDEVVEVLLNHGASVSNGGQFNITAIYSAALNGNLKIVEMLLNNGADASRGYPYKKTPLDGACSGGHVNVVQMLLKLGACPKGHSLAKLINRTARHPDVVAVLKAEGGKDCTIS